MVTYEEMFRHYKDRLCKEAYKTDKTKHIRYCVIEYLCSFPKLDPVRMAAEMIREGIKVYFDNMAISDRENKVEERAVLREIKRQEEKAGMLL